MRPASAPNEPNHFGKLSSSTAHHNSASADTATHPTALPLIIAAPQPRPFTHAFTEPPPRIHKEPSKPEFPHALVLSGLEHASVWEQASLAQALTRRQVVFESFEHGSNLVDPSQKRTPSRNNNVDVHSRSNSALFQSAEYEGTWNLPDGFVMVYVCPWNSRERPSIHRTLLDLFAMSSTIFVQKHIRDALKALPFASNPTSPYSRMHSSYSNPPSPSPQSPSPAPPRTPPGLSQALPGTLRPRTSRNVMQQPTPIVPKQLLPRDFILSLQKTAQSAYVSSQLSLYLSDLFSAVRHHPKLDGTFLTARSMNDASDLARAGRILGTDPTGGELLQKYSSAEYQKEDDEEEEAQNNSEMYQYIASGSESITLNVPREDNLTQSFKDNDAAFASQTEHSNRPLFISEAAIARVVPRAVTHRLRVRDGPEDEVLASAIFGATFDHEPHPSNSQYGWDTRSTIKDILVEILAEV
ncbi:hypothetical protein H0H87_005454 [Tephrocybe sp. NHM501043]|nr:hypothetical protein H0H87_005454 [Tephrocybe sp. NHM501043]